MIAEVILRIIQSEAITCRFKICWNEHDVNRGTADLIGCQEKVDDVPEGVSQKTQTINTSNMYTKTRHNLKASLADLPLTAQSIGSEI